MFLPCAGKPAPLSFSPKTNQHQSVIDTIMFAWREGTTQVRCGCEVKLQYFAHATLPGTTTSGVKISMSGRGRKGQVVWKLFLKTLRHIENSINVMVFEQRCVSGWHSRLACLPQPQLLETDRSIYSRSSLGEFRSHSSCSLQFYLQKREKFRSFNGIWDFFFLNKCLNVPFCQIPKWNACFILAQSWVFDFSHLQSGLESKEKAKRNEKHDWFICKYQSV